MKTDEQFDLLFDSANTLLDISERNEEDLKKLLVDITKTSAYLEHISTNIHKKLTTEVTNSTNTIAKHVVHNVTKSLNSANIAAEEATSKYKRAVKTSVFKLYGLFAIFSVTVAAIIWFLFLKDIPTISKINELRDIQYSLEQDVNKLKSYGNVDTYDGYIYVEVDNNKCWTFEGKTSPQNQMYCKVIERK